MKPKPKRNKETDALSPEKRKLVDAFNQARAATAPPAGFTVDLEAVARKAVSAYWEAKTARPDLDDIRNPASPMDRGLKRAALARIDSARVFVRGIFTSALPTVASFALVVLGFAILQRGALESGTKILYVLPSSFLLAAVCVSALFALRRTVLLASRWIVLQTQSGPLVGGLIAAAAVAWFAISATNQKMQVNQYKTEVQLESVLTEVQPIAAQALSSEQSSGQLPQDFYSQLKDSKLGKRADITKVDQTTNPEQTVYKIQLHDDAAEAASFDVVVKPDRIEIGSENTPGYVMLKDSIGDVSADTFTLVSKTKSEDSASMPLTGWDQNKTSEIKGSKVMVTYDEVLKKPVGVSLLDRPGRVSIYDGQNLDARINRIAVTKTTKSFQ
jgi:hypothetical protein